MKRTLRSLFLAPCLIAALPSLSLPAHSQEKEKEQIKGVLAEPADAAEVREQIAVVEKLKTVVPDRGAVLFFLSTAKQHLGETREALELLKECLKLREGFDPSGSPSFSWAEGHKGIRRFSRCRTPRLSGGRTSPTRVRHRGKRSHPRRVGVRREAEPLLFGKSEPEKDREDRCGGKSFGFCACGSLWSLAGSRNPA